MKSKTYDGVLLCGKSIGEVEVALLLLCQKTIN